MDHLSVNMRTHQPTPNQGTFYKIMSQYASKDDETLRITKELAEMGGDNNNVDHSLDPGPEEGYESEKTVNIQISL